MRAAAIALAAGLAIGAAAGWWIQGLRAGRALAEVQQQHAQQEQARAEQSQVATTTRAGALLEHAGAQQDNTHEYTHKLAQLEAGRTADGARIERLQHDIRAAATAHAQAAGDAAACRDLADRHERLAELAGEGASLVVEADRLVKQRDAQVELLQGQVRADRALLDQLQPAQ